MFESEFDNSEIDRIKCEFKRLRDAHYLDHAGASQYSERQLGAVLDNLSSNIYSNPHTSKTTEDIVDQVRYQVLNFLNTNADEYSVIFTSGATDALKLVGESFCFGDGGAFVYLRDNHTSVLGMREIVQAKRIICLERSEFLNREFSKLQLSSAMNSLFVFPAQCNFSGFKYPLELIDEINDDSGRLICLDAASFVSTSPLDLQIHHPDFVCISFYKIFGFPTGLGALLVRRRAEKFLKKKYYGGGTVKISLSDISMWHQKRDSLHERFEDGTISYLSIISLLSGFETLKRLVPGRSLERISRHCFNLAKYLYNSLRNLKHLNGRPVVRFYVDSNFESENEQGGIVTFNILNFDGTYVGFAEVNYLAQLRNITLRTGCFCNPGACQRHLQLTNDDLKVHFQAGHICGDGHDLIDGVPTGAVRVSVGYSTTIENIEAVIRFIRECYAERALHSPIEKETIRRIYRMVIPKTKKKNAVFLRQICVYPVKSCAPFRVQSKWPITRRGMKYDREWMIVRSNGVSVTQKSDTKLCLIQPTINENENFLQLDFPHTEPICVPLRPKKISSSHCQSKVCGDRIEGIDCGDDVAAWLSYVLCTPGIRLVQQTTNDKRSTKNGSGEAEQAISLSNQAQFLLISTASVEWLARKVHEWREIDDYNEKILQNMIDRFRANFIIEANVPLEEMEWKFLTLDSKLRLKVEGPCSRCQMICIDQSTGEKTTEPLQTICREFQGKMKFGIYLSQIDPRKAIDDLEISCNTEIFLEK